MHLVAGATGFLGTEICSRLVGRNHRVRGLVRTSSDPERVRALKELGVAAVTGDLRDRASLENACQGVEFVISTVNSVTSRQAGDGFEATDGEGHANLIRTAAAAGVERFIFVSLSANLGGDDPLTRAKRATEQRLADSGMAYTVLRPSLFMEVWLGPHAGFDYGKGEVIIFGEGVNPISFISLRDVAEFAVFAADDAGAENDILELGGPRPVAPLDVVRTFESRLGRQFSVTHVPEDALREQMDNAADPIARTFASLQLSYARGDEIPMDGVLTRYPVSLLDVEDYAASRAPSG